MPEYLSTTKIIDLPPEVLIKILNKLPLSDIKAVRLTCLAFNDVGIYYQKMALRKMRNKADAVLKKCHTGFKNINETSVLRALKGTASVNCLTGIIRIADACTFHFLRDEKLPAPPTVLLEEVKKALDIAARKNPLVGRDRLKLIFSGLDAYLRLAMNSLSLQPKTMSVFRATLDLLVSLPLKTYNIIQKPYGLDCIIYLNPLTLMINFGGLPCYQIPASLLLQLLSELNIKAIEEHVQTDMGKLFTYNSLPVEARIYVIELYIVCKPEDGVGMATLQQLFQLETTEFHVRLRAVTRFLPIVEHGIGNVLHIRPAVLTSPLYENELNTYFLFTSIQDGR